MLPRDSMNQNLQLHKPNWWAETNQRIKWAFRSLFAPRLQPLIELGGGVVFDLESRTLHLPADYKIKSTGTLVIESDKHLIFNSGRTPEERDGYYHSVWFNTDLDEEGRPIRDDDPRYLHGRVEDCKECDHD